MANMLLAGHMRRPLLLLVHFSYGPSIAFFVIICPPPETKDGSRRNKKVSQFPQIQSMKSNPHVVISLLVHQYAVNRFDATPNIQRQAGLVPSSCRSWRRPVLRATAEHSTWVGGIGRKGQGHSDDFQLGIVYSQDILCSEISAMEADAAFLESSWNTMINGIAQASGDTGTSPDSIRPDTGRT